MEEVLVTRAEIVKAIFAGRSRVEAMLGALAVSGKAYIALLAVGRQRGRFRASKSSLLR